MRVLGLRTVVFIYPRLKAYQTSANWINTIGEANKGSISGPTKTHLLTVF